MAYNNYREYNRERQKSIREYHYKREAFEKSKQTNGFKGWRRAQYEAQGYHCAWCYKEINLYKGTQVDHVHPILEGGSNDFSNLVLCCKACNKRKGATSFNFAAYNNSVKRLQAEGKIHDYHIAKDCWRVPSWIKNNKYSNVPDYSTDKDEYVGTDDRNIWNKEFPIEYEEGYEGNYRFLDEPSYDDEDEAYIPGQTDVAKESELSIDEDDDDTAGDRIAWNLGSPGVSTYDTVYDRDKSTSKELGDSGKIWFWILLILFIIILIGTTLG